MPPDHPLPILFTHFGDRWIRGSEMVLLDLLRHLDSDIVRPVVWCNGTEIAEACHAAGHTVHQTDFTFYLDQSSPRFDPRAYRAVVHEGNSLVQRYGIRVLHANSAAPTQWLVPIARGNRLPLLTHLHTDYLRRSRYVLLLHQADRVIGVSEQVVQALQRDGMSSERIKVIYNGVDFARLTENPPVDLRSALDVPRDAILLGAAGSLIARKGYDVLLRALAQLDGATLPHLAIAGSGPEEASLRGLAAELGVAGRVHFLGYHRDIADIYASCDIFCGPSRAEAFGLVFAEAGYFGRPVVATRVGGIPEVVADEETGLLVMPEDSSALAGAIGRLAANPDMRHRLGEAGRRRAETLFSVTRMAAAFAAEYVRLAGLPSAGLGWGSVLRRSGLYLRKLTG